MKKIQLLITGLIIFLMSACSKKPSASFSTDKTSIEVEQTVTFTNTSENGSKYLWDFGDGTTSEEESPSHTYQNVGNYTIILTAYNSNKKKSSDKSIIISVTEALFKFSGTIGGIQKTFIDDDVNFESVISSSGSIALPLLEYELGFGITKKSSNGGPGIGIDIGKLAFLNTTPDQQRYNLFADLIKVKSYSFITGTSGNPTNGVKIDYTDESGSRWATNLGSGNQTGSSFTIVSAKYVKPELDDPYILFKATFKVKIYTAQGNVQEITNGIMTGVFEYPTF